MTKKPKHIVLINGPARAGKDSLAAAFRQVVGNERSSIEKFANPLKQMTHAMFGFPNVPSDHFESVKDDAQNGPMPGSRVTWRQAYIAVSERLMKPLFGEDVFGRLLADHLERSTSEYVFVSDSGFVAEAEVIVRQFPGRVSLVQVSRKGHSFAGDSRGWVRLADHVPQFAVTNNGTLDSLVNRATTILVEMGVR